MEKIIDPCWLSPLGEVRYCKLNHGLEAVSIIEEKYNDPANEELLEKYGFDYDLFLEDKGWIKYTHNTSGCPMWAFGCRRLTKKQLDKMFELTGYIQKT